MQSVARSRRSMKAFTQKGTWKHGASLAASSFSGRGSCNDMRTRSNPVIHIDPPSRLPPMLEAAGAKSGHPEDAGAGMPSWIDGTGKKWVFNRAMGEWQVPHTIKSGDTLWKLSGVYHGKPSLPGVHAIYNVPQNKAIQGPSADSGLIPGDVILIPGLQQPSQAPAASDAPPIAVPQTPVTAPPVPTPPGSPLPFPVPSNIPISWPSDLDYPPTQSPSGGDIVLTSTGGGVHPEVLPTTTVTGMAASKPKAEPFWTTTKI